MLLQGSQGVERFDTWFLHSHTGCGGLADGATLRHFGSTPSRDDNPDEAHEQQTRRFPAVVRRGM